MRSNAELDVLQMFGPGGNWDDYWLGTPRYTNSFLQDDQHGWVSAEELFRVPDDDGPDDETLFLMRAPGKPEGGGLQTKGGAYSVSPEFFDVASGIRRAGERALDEERKLQRRKAFKF